MTRWSFAVLRNEVIDDRRGFNRRASGDCEAFDGWLDEDTFFTV